MLNSEAGKSAPNAICPRITVVVALVAADKDLLGLFCMRHCHPLTNRLSVQRHNFAVGKLFRCIDTQVAQAEIVYLQDGYKNTVMREGLALLA